MIGYYVHHQGRGHLHRALSVASALDTVVVGMSSLPRPAGWAGPWLELPRDDEGASQVDATAGGRLHWVPEKDAGLSARMAEISSWIEDVAPDLMIVDVSVEVALLARLHGTPVVTMALPGDRHDPAHDLVHSLARRIVAAWPADVAGMVQGLDPHGDRLLCVGGLSRFDGREPGPGPSAGGGRRVVILMGAGGAAAADADAAWDVGSARASTPGWTWDVLAPGHGWVDDPWELMCGADVVITHAGQNAIAEVAAARRPAVVVPQPRPFGEQDAMASALAQDGRFPVTVCHGGLPAEGMAELLDRTAGLDGERWAAWNDGRAATRLADAVLRELDRTPVRQP